MPQPRPLDRARSCRAAGGGSPAQGTSWFAPNHSSSSGSSAHQARYWVPTPIHQTSWSTVWPSARCRRTTAASDPPRFTSCDSGRSSSTRVTAPRSTPASPGRLDDRLTASHGIALGQTEGLRGLEAARDAPERDDAEEGEQDRMGERRPRAAVLAAPSRHRQCRSDRTGPGCRRTPEPCRGSTDLRRRRGLRGAVRPDVMRSRRPSSAPTVPVYGMTRTSTTVRSVWSATRCVMAAQRCAECTTPQGRASGNPAHAVASSGANRSASRRVTGRP